MKGSPRPRVFQRCDRTPVQAPHVAQEDKVGLDVNPMMARCSILHAGCSADPWNRIIIIIIINTCHFTMNSVSLAQKNLHGSVAVAPQQQKSARFPARRTVARRVQASSQVSDEGFELMRKGVKVAADETILTPRYVRLCGRARARGHVSPSYRHQVGTSLTDLIAIVIQILHH